MIKARCYLDAVFLGRRSEIKCASPDAASSDGAMGQSEYCLTSCSGHGKYIIISSGSANRYSVLFFLQPPVHHECD